MAVTVPPAVPIGWDPSVDDLVAPQPTLFDLVEQGPRPTVNGRGLPVERIHQLARSVIEVLEGHRPATQLARWMTEPVQASLALTVRRRAAPGPPLRIASVHCDDSITDVVEVALRVVAGQRSTAMAFRLERQRRVWVCTAWEHRPSDLAALGGRDG